MLKPEVRFVDDPIWRHLGNPKYGEHGPLGFRPSVALEGSDALLTGSSHAYGTNLFHGLSWPTALVKRGRNVFDASMGAWSMMQYALVAEKYLRPNHKYFIIALYLGFDVYATLKHSQQTGSEFARRVAEDLFNVPEMGWQKRDARDAFIRAKVANGASTLEALKMARDANMADTFSLLVNGKELWLEPQLRLTTMNIAQPYIRASLTAATRYLSFIKSTCDYNGSKLALVLLPTREYVTAKALGVEEGPLNEVAQAQDRLMAQIAEEAGPLVDLLYDMTPTYISHYEEGIFSPPDHAPLDGHPSAHGASIIADSVDELIYGRTENWA